MGLPELSICRTVHVLRLRRAVKRWFVLGAKSVEFSLSRGFVLE